MPPIRLSPREEQVLRHVRAGGSNKDIADALGISEQAIKALVSRLLLKFGVRNRTTLANESERFLHPGKSGAVPHLGDVLKRSRELRERNQSLMDQLRVELRDFKRVRRDIANGRGTNGRRRPPDGGTTPYPSPPARRAAP